MQSEVHEVVAQAQEWLRLDPDNADVLEREITAALEGDDTAYATLSSRFSRSPRFGAAGVRAPLGSATTRMNRGVVQRAARGMPALAPTRVSDPVVATGYAARPGPQQFALHSAAVLTA